MTFELQVGKYLRMIVEGELRSADHKLGPGGILKIIGPSGMFVSVGDEVRMIALPDAPKTTRVNKERLAVEEKVSRK